MHVAADGGGGEGMIPTPVAGAPADEMRSRARALAVLVAVLALPLWAATLLLLVSKATTLGFVSPLGLILIGLSAVLGGLVVHLWRFASGRCGSATGAGELELLLLQRLPLVMGALLLDVVIVSLFVRGVQPGSRRVQLSGAGEVALWGGLAAEILLFLFGLGLMSRARTSRSLRWVWVTTAVLVCAVAAIVAVTHVSVVPELVR